MHWVGQAIIPNLQKKKLKRGRESDLSKESHSCQPQEAGCKDASSSSEPMCRIKGLEIRDQHPAPPQSVKSQHDLELVPEFSGTWLSCHSSIPHNTVEVILAARSTESEMVRPLLCLVPPSSAWSHLALHPWASYWLSSKLGTIPRALTQQHEMACNMFTHVTDTNPMPCTLIWMPVTGLYCPGCCAHGSLCYQIC